MPRLLICLLVFCLCTGILFCDATHETQQQLEQQRQFPDENGENVALGWEDEIVGTIHPEMSATVPTPIFTEGDLKGVKIVGAAAGGHHSLVLSDSGRVYSFGLNDQGQLGDGTLFTRTVPVPVHENGALYFQAITAIAAGNRHSLLLSGTGTVFSFGDNEHGQLGRGEDSTSPQTVPLPIDSSSHLEGKFVTQIAAGGDHSLVLTKDGQLFAFGRNDNGQQGDGTTKSNFAPKPVYSEGVLNGVVITAIAAGQDSSLVLADSGQLFSFGKNYAAQIDDHSTIPVEIRFVAGVSRSTLSAKNEFGFAIGSSQGLLSFLRPQGGQIPNSMGPNVQNHGNSQFDAISAGGGHFLLLKDGMAFSFGKNDEGQLGDGSTISSSFPVPVQTSGALSGLKIKAIAAGGSHSLLVADNGQVFGFGNNTVGQLGTTEINLASSQKESLIVGMSMAGVVAWLYVSIAGIISCAVIFCTRENLKYPSAVLVVVGLFTIPFWISLMLSVVFLIVGVCALLIFCSVLAGGGRETVWINGRQYLVRHN